MQETLTPFDSEARRLGALLPAGRRIGVLGSTDFWHPDSERTCAEIGRLLASIHGLILLTGGVEGIGEAIGRCFFEARHNAALEPRVFHVLPEGEPAWDYGATMFAGSDMRERREILARLTDLYLIVEGGPGTRHEADVAFANNAIVVPVGRSGGFAGEMYAQSSCPSWLDIRIWNILGAREATPDETALAAFRALSAALESTGQGKE